MEAAHRDSLRQCTMDGEQVGSEELDAIAVARWIRFVRNPFSVIITAAS